MEDSKLIQLLSTFSKEELRELKKFVANPFFNQRHEALALLDLYAKARAQNNPIPSKEKVFYAIFDKGSSFDDHRVRLAMSALLQTAEKYLAVQDLLGDQQAFQFRLSKIFRARSLSEPATSAWQAGTRALENRVWRNAEHYYESYKFQEEKYRAALNSPAVETQNLQMLSDELDVAFLSRKLWQACFLLAHQARYSAPCDFGLLEQIVPAVTKYLHLPAISIYYHCYLSLTQPDESQHFQAFKKELLAYGDLFPPDELRDLYILAINFCTRRYNEGDLRFLQDQFELYQIGFDNKYFLLEGVLSRFTYLNAATSGLKVRAFAWVEKLIIEYRQFLEQPYQESLFAFNMARLEYLKNNFGAALTLLQRAEYKETMLALAAKTLQMKIYYESDEYDLLESHLQAIAAFIRRKKIMGYHRDNYTNMLLMVRKLMDINPLDKNSKQLLRDKIAAMKPLAEKEWLLEKL